MQNPDDGYWRTDAALFSGLTGGQAIIDWFGSVSSFHDAKLDRLVLADGGGALIVRCFRMTGEIDSCSYYVLDRHAVVTIHLDEISGLALAGDAGSVISDLGIRRVQADPPRFLNCPGPSAGDFEVKIESSYGLEGSIYARQRRLALAAA